MSNPRNFKVPKPVKRPFKVGHEPIAEHLTTLVGKPTNLRKPRRF